MELLRDNAAFSEELKKNTHFIYIIYLSQQTYWITAINTQLHFSNFILLLIWIYIYRNTFMIAVHINEAIKAI